MIDQYGRNINYLRVSVTDRCNLSCNYCAPKNCIKYRRDEMLRYEEILRIAKVMAELGTETVRITGGEPLMRRNIEELVTGLRNIEGIKKVTMTTNGVLLSQHLNSLVNAGLEGINISLDTLKPHRFKRITGYNMLERVKDSIFLAAEAPVKIKVNCVIQKGINEDEIVELAGLAEKKPIQVRFIEMMPIGLGKYMDRVSNEQVFATIKEAWGEGSYERCEETENGGNGPAKYYKFQDFSGKIGFISAINEKFCNNCNRIRLTADGSLKACLASSSEVNLKHIIRNGGSDEKLRTIIGETITNKPREHHFEDFGSITEGRCMYRIGG